MARRSRSSARTSARTRVQSVLLLAAGALGGLAVGVVVADRLGGLDGIRRRLGSTRQRRHRDDGWRGDDRRSQPFDQLADDHSELAPEAIAHLHLHGRHPEREPRRRSLVGRAELERRVFESFRNDPILAACAIDISAVRGDVVELTGWVGESSIVTRAETIAKGVPGVRGVRSALLVLSGA